MCLSARALVTRSGTLAGQLQISSDGWPSWLSAPLPASFLQAVLSIRSHASNSDTNRYVQQSPQRSPHGANALKRAEIVLLRSISKHVKAQNWTAVILDFVIVVVGVFIGIQVANWNDARVNRATESTYLDLLQRDLRTTVQEVEKQIAFEQFQLQLTNAALPVIEETPSRLRQRKLGILLTRLSGRRTLKIDSPTFLDLQSSGRLGLISDRDLRSAILSYFFGIQRWEAVIDKNNEHFVDTSFNNFLDDFSIGYWLWEDEVVGSAPPGIVSSILQHQKSLIDNRLADAGGAVLMRPPDDVFWDDVKARLAKRGGIAAANKNIAERLRDETALLEEKISTHLAERR